MEITRRNLLGAGAAVGAGLLLPLRMTTSANAVVPTGVLPFTEPLPTLANFGVIDARSGGTFAISMENATHQFHTNLAATPTFTYKSTGGTQEYLGPVIVAKKGQAFDLEVTNNLGKHPLASAIDTGIMGAIPGDATAPRTAVHLHGGNTDPGSDGDPMDFFAQGNTKNPKSGRKTYHYGNTQEAAGLWYHDHALGITRLNVFAGLAGGYLLRDDNDPGDGTLRVDGSGLPPAPTYEVPLILQDRMFNPDGTFLYPINPGPLPPAQFPQKWIPEFFGDVATVNGKIQPNLDVAQGKYRFRVLNGSNARFYNLKLRSAGPANIFYQIGSDGGLLNAPVPLTSLLLAPGERADIVIDFATVKAGSKIVLTNDANTPFPSGPTAVRRGGVPLPQIMQFTVTGTAGWTAPLPANLRANTSAVTPLAGLIPAQTRSMDLVELLDPFGVPLMVLMNNRTFEATCAAPITPASNTLEQWDLINTTVDAHPMHLHFTEFQVLNRQKFDSAGYLLARFGPRPANAPIWPIPDAAGNTVPVTPYLKGNPTAPPPNEQGWKDTIVAMPGEVTRILIPFGATIPGTIAPMAIGASHTGDYVSHCHILEHEENDMMMRFKIV